MKQAIRHFVSPARRATIKNVLGKYKLPVLKILGAFGWCASAYYFLFSRQFDREHKAVLQGRVLYQKSLTHVGRSSALIRRNIHRLEKGLIMQPRRAVFATDYITETVDMYSKAVQQATLCDAELKWATDVLTEYFAVVEDNAVIAKARALFSGTVRSESSATTSIPYAHQTLPPAAVSFADLSALFLRRRSVRWYQQKPVDPQLIRQAVNIATLAPSACNRQPYRFDVLSNPLDAAEIARCAMGTTGFADNIPCLIVVLGDLSCYPAERDRHVIYIDASLAAMQLMLALETLGLSTCPINWPDIEQREAKIQEKLSLAYHERPVMLMAVGYADPQGGVPFSQKKTDELLVREVKMYIEIKGVQFVNKGAELMLHAVLQQLAVLRPDARIVLQSNSSSPYVARAKLGAYQKAGLRFFGIEFNAYSHWLPKKVRNWLIQQYGIVTEADIAMVLDASGFAYGSQWPEKNALYLADELERFARKGKSYVFLPQAFGPFTRPLEQKRLKESLGCAALVCARDESSFAYMQQLMGPSDRLCQLPDFTNLVQPAQLESQLPANTLMIIPNHQMLSARNPNPLWRQHYLAVLRHFIDIAEQNAMHIVVLNHEGVKDLELCQQLLQGKSEKIELVSEPDPLKVKALIGQSRAVVCSRFHGCVSALSQGIPCIGTSWSHKYEALFADYQSTELLIRPDLTEQQLQDAFILMLNKDKTLLQQESARFKHLSELLWTKVASLV